MKYSVFFVYIVTALNTGKFLEVVAVDRDAAVADVMETYTGIQSVEVGWLRSA